MERSQPPQEVPAFDAGHLLPAHATEAQSAVLEAAQSTAPRYEAGPEAVITLDELSPASREEVLRLDASSHLATEQKRLNAHYDQLDAERAARRALQAAQRPALMAEGEQAAADHVRAELRRKAEKSRQEMGVIFGDDLNAQLGAMRATSEETAAQNRQAAADKAAAAKRIYQEHIGVGSTQTPAEDIRVNDKRHNKGVAYDASVFGSYKEYLSLSPVEREMRASQAASEAPASAASAAGNVLHGSAADVPDVPLEAVRQTGPPPVEAAAHGTVFVAGPAGIEAGHVSDGGVPRVTPVAEAARSNDPQVDAAPAAAREVTADEILDAAGVAAQAATEPDEAAVFTGDTAYDSGHPEAFFNALFSEKDGRPVGVQRRAAEILSRVPDADPSNLEDDPFAAQIAAFDAEHGYGITGPDASPDLTADVAAAAAGERGGWRGFSRRRWADLARRTAGHAAGMAATMRDMVGLDAHNRQGIGQGVRSAAAMAGRGSKALALAGANIIDTVATPVSRRLTQRVENRAERREASAERAPRRRSRKVRMIGLAAMIGIGGTLAADVVYSTASGEKGPVMTVLSGVGNEANSDRGDMSPPSMVETTTTTASADTLAPGATAPLDTLTTFAD